MDLRSFSGPIEMTLVTQVVSGSKSSRGFSMEIEKLKETYKINTAAKAICDELESRSKNQNVTMLDRMIQLLAARGLDLKRSEVIAGFRKLEDAGCGQFVEGRHSYKSRFVWQIKTLDVASAAKGQGSLEQTKPEDTQDDYEMIEHTFVLRPDLPVSFELPEDLTTAESTRLASFIQALPFSSGS